MLYFFWGEKVERCFSGCFGLRVGIGFFEEEIGLEYRLIRGRREGRVF